MEEHVGTAGLDLMDGLVSLLELRLDDDALIFAKAPTGSVMVVG